MFALISGFPQFYYSYDGLTGRFFHEDVDERLAKFIV